MGVNKWALILTLCIATAAAIGAGASTAGATPYSFTTTGTAQVDGTLQGYSLPASLGACDVLATAGHFMEVPATVSTGFYSVTGVLLHSAVSHATNCLSTPQLPYVGTGGYEVTSGLPANSNTTYTLKYSCDNTAQAFDVYVNGSQVDNFGNVPLRMMGDCGGYITLAECFSYESQRSMALPDYGTCRNFDSTLPIPPSGPVDIDTTAFINGYRSWAYPFNASSGEVTITITAQNSSRGTFTCHEIGSQYGYEHGAWLVNRKTYASEMVYYTAGGCDDYAGVGMNDFDNGENITIYRDNLTLDAEYMLFYGVAFGNLGFAVDLQLGVGEPDVNISVGMKYPDWDCDPWSECVDGQELRECVDLGGHFLDIVEARNCSAVLPGVIESADLGFEAGRAVTVTTCRPGVGWLGNCVMANQQDLLYNFSVEWPDNWTIIPNQDTFTHTPYFAQLTNEWAASGTRSLKLWRIPSANFEPGWLDSQAAMWCVNQSNILNPSTIKDFNNDTMRVSYDVTFPAEYMTVSFVARACSALPERTPALGNFLAYCDRTCYGNCSSSNPGDFRFAITHNDTGALVMEKYLTVADAATPYMFALPAVEASKTYRIQFAPYSNNPGDQRGNCVMFDAVYYNVTASELAGEGGACAPKCAGNNGLDFYLPIPGDTCAYTVEYMSSKCVPSAKAASFAARLDTCIGSTLYTFDNSTGRWATLINSTQCQEEQAAEALTKGSLGLPEDSPMAPLNSLLSPIFIALVINIVLAAVCAVGVGKFAEGAGSAVGAVFLGVLLCVALVFSFVGIYPAILGVMIVIISGLLLAALVRGMMAGGG